MQNNTLSAFILCSVLLFACKKKEKNEVLPGGNGGGGVDTIIQITADFPDVAYLDSPAVFTTNAPAGYDVIWDFGDSTTSTERNPAHEYKKTGKYYTKFTVSKNGSSPYVLYDSVIVSNKYFNRMEGVRNWHYSVHYSILNYNSIDSTYVYPDQSFALTILQPNSIVLPDNIYKGTTLIYTGIDNGTLSFWAFDSSVFPNVFDMYYDTSTDVVTIKYTGINKDPNGSGGRYSTWYVVTAVSY